MEETKTGHRSSLAPTIFKTAGNEDSSWRYEVWNRPTWTWISSGKQGLLMESMLEFQIFVPNPRKLPELGPEKH